MTSAPKSESSMDRPPDLAAALDTGRETRRLLAMARWPLLLGIGSISALFTAALMVAGRNEQARDLLSGAWALAIVVPGLAWPSLSQRLRARMGAFALQYGEGRRRSHSRVSSIGLVGGVVIAVGLMGAALLLGGEESRWLALAPVCLIGLLLGIRIVVWAVGLRLWEFVLIGLLVPVLPAYYLFCGSGAWRFWPWPMLVCFVAVSAAGASLGLRWRVWVRSLPREEDEAGVQEAKP